MLVFGSLLSYFMRKINLINICQDLYCVQVSVPALSGEKGPGATAITNLSWEQEQKQKV